MSILLLKKILRIGSEQIKIGRQFATKPLATADVAGYHRGVGGDSFSRLTPMGYREWIEMGDERCNLR
jgi:hypothetical protein